MKNSLCSSSLKWCYRHWGLTTVWQALLTLNLKQLQFRTRPKLKATFFKNFWLNALSATFAMLMGWRCAVLPQRLAEMSVCSVAKSQTDLYDQTTSARVYWLLGNGLNFRKSGEKSTREQKKLILFTPVSSLWNIIKGFKQALCDID